jgi:hypothetical protein
LEEPIGSIGRPPDRAQLLHDATKISVCGYSRDHVRVEWLIRAKTYAKKGLRGPFGGSALAPYGLHG